MDKPAKRKLILVVDDDKSVRQLVVKALQTRGHEVVEAQDGMAASELLGSATLLPDLLICDVMMPTIDGFSLAKLVPISQGAQGHPDHLPDGEDVSRRRRARQPPTLLAFTTSTTVDGLGRPRWSWTWTRRSPEGGGHFGLDRRGSMMLTS